MDPILHRIYQQGFSFAGIEHLQEGISEFTAALPAHKQKDTYIADEIALILRRLQMGDAGNGIEKEYAVLDSDDNNLKCKVEQFREQQTNNTLELVSTGKHIAYGFEIKSDKAQSIDDALWQLSAKEKELFVVCDELGLRIAKPAYQDLPVGVHLHYGFTGVQEKLAFLEKSIALAPELLQIGAKTQENHFASYRVAMYFSHEIPDDITLHSLYILRNKSFANKLNPIRLSMKNTIELTFLDSGYRLSDDAPGVRAIDELLLQTPAYAIEKGVSWLFAEATRTDYFTKYPHRKKLLQNALTYISDASAVYVEDKLFRNKTYKNPSSFLDS